MRKPYGIKPTLLSVLFAASLLPAFAQRTNAPLSSRAPLIRLAETYRTTRALQWKVAMQMAAEKQWPVFRSLPGGGVLQLERVDKLGLPIYTITGNNIRSAATTLTDQLWPGGSSGLNLRGAAPILESRLGIWDGGALRASHREFTGRIDQRDGALPMNNHATHVAGTLIAAGLNRPVRGMAFGAPGLVAYDFFNDNAEMAGEAPMLLISNHSYGALAGWRYNESQSRWEWYGPSGETEDYKFGYYDLTSREWDQIAFNAPYYLIVKSAGNNRNVNGPGEGADYFRYNDKGVMAAAPADAPFPEPNDGYDILPLYASAKNILLVGAIHPIPGGYTQPEDAVMTSFSNWGPTDDGRIKPDLMANGMGVLSTSSAADDAYTMLSGTSMASPNVAGSLLLLQELYARQHDGAFMRAATLKGLAIHTAGEAGPSPGPDYRFGWGVLNVAKAADVLVNPANTHLLTEASLEESAEDQYELVATGYTPLEVTLSWTDPEADTIPEAEALDNPAPRLVNDLDIRVTSAETGTVYFPWILDPSQPENAATTGDNILDNVEKLVIASPAHGGTYSLSVTHKGTLERAPQLYSLIISGAGGHRYCVSEADDPDGLSIVSFEAGTLSYHATTSCTVHTDLLSERIPARPGTTLPFTITTGACGSTGDHVIKLFADWNNDGIFGGSGETVAISTVLPANSTFNGNIQVPGELSPGAILRLRVVAVRTTDANAVTACGTYSEGETLETAIEIVRPERDIAVRSLASPIPAFCPGDRQLVRILLRNEGTQPLENITLTAAIDLDGTPVASFGGSFEGQLLPGDTTIYTFPYYFMALPDASYEIAIEATAAGDEIETNNHLTATRKSGARGASPDAAAFICEDGQTILLSSGPEAVYWYEDAQGNEFIGAGDTVSTTVATTGTTYYAAVNEFIGQVGPADKSAFPPVTDGHAYHQYTPSVLIQTYVPLVIESARMYTGNAGTISVTVYTATGTEVARSVQHVAASRTDPAPGPLPDDPLDTGRTYFLNLRIPQPGSYVITVDYEDSDATVFRNDNSDGYPFSVPGVMSITGSTAGDDGNYYYFYGMKVKALGCASPRIAVQGTMLPIPGITSMGDTLFTDGRVGLQWFFNGAAVDGATGSQLLGEESGVYEVSVTLGNCSVRSSPYTFTTVGDLIAALEHNGLKLYPNPGPASGSDPLHVEFYARSQDNVLLSIFDLQGKLLYREPPALQSGRNIVQLGLDGLPPGGYLLNLQINDQQFTREFIIHR